MENKKNSLKEKLIPLSLSIAVILLDQITKALVVKYIPQLTDFAADDAKKIIPIFGDYFRLIHVRNPAVAFSIGASLSHNARVVLFSVIPLLVVAAVYVIYFKNNEFTKVQRWAICGILGGGLGNLIDRFFRPQGVVDFCDGIWFGLKDSKLSILRWQRWPTFNVADSAVVVCGIIFIVSFVVLLVRDSKKIKNAKKEEKSA